MAEPITDRVDIDRSLLIRSLILTAETHSLTILSRSKNHFKKPLQSFRL